MRNLVSGLTMLGVVGVAACANRGLGEPGLQHVDTVTLRGKIVFTEPVRYKPTPTDVAAYLHPAEPFAVAPVDERGFFSLTLSTPRFAFDSRPLTDVVRLPCNDDPVLSPPDARATMLELYWRETVGPYAGNQGYLRARTDTDEQWTFAWIDRPGTYGCAVGDVPYTFGSGWALLGFQPEEAGGMGVSEAATELPSVHWRSDPF